MKQLTLSDMAAIGYERVRAEGASEVTVIAIDGGLVELPDDDKR